jgi:hypothetical protein
MKISTKMRERYIRLHRCENKERSGGKWRSSGGGCDEDGKREIRKLQ